MYMWEGTSRRNYLHLTGVPEGMKGPHPTNCVAQLLRHILKASGTRYFDWTHRSQGRTSTPSFHHLDLHHSMSSVEFCDVLAKSPGPPHSCTGGENYSSFLTTIPLSPRGVLPLQVWSGCPAPESGLLFQAGLEITLPGRLTAHLMIWTWALLMQVLKGQSPPVLWSNGRSFVSPL